ncbi:MAG: DUF421 domain-containing protein [Clostridia bacterium]|nr:DUF421 domain-containing protein [Clostridia bacterium]MDY6183955.1 DUF421 domain-containing protein [Eubacteriales bacterium]
MISLFFRTFLLFAFLTLMLRLMGKRQVGEMEVSELVTTLLLSEIAALPMEDTDFPVLYAIVPILVIFSFEVIITFLKTKWNPLKKLFESKPVFLIKRGVLDQKELGKNRISLGELLSELRIQGISTYGDAYYAILEQNGKLSVVKRAKPDETEKGISHTLVSDGKLSKEAMKDLGLTEENVLALCRAEGATPEEIFLLLRDDAGTVTCIKKEETNA